MNLSRKRKYRNRNIMKRGIQMKGRKCNGNSKEVTMSAPLVHTEKRKAKGRMTQEITGNAGRVGKGNRSKFYCPQQQKSKTDSKECKKKKKKSLQIVVQQFACKLDAKRDI